MCYIIWKYWVFGGYLSILIKISAKNIITKKTLTNKGKQLIWLNKKEGNKKAPQFVSLCRILLIFTRRPSRKHFHPVLTINGIGVYVLKLSSDIQTHIHIYKHNEEITKIVGTAGQSDSFCICPIRHLLADSWTKCPTCPAGRKTN